MDLDLTIRYSDDRLCEVVVCQPSEGNAIYRIITRRADLGESLTEAMQVARRLYADTPWSNRRQRNSISGEFLADLAPYRVSGARLLLTR
jgi:hypothetical protein